MSEENLIPAISAIEKMMETLQPYKEAISVIQQNNNFAGLMAESFADRFDLMENAVSHYDRLAHALAQYQL